MRLQGHWPVEFRVLALQVSSVLVAVLASLLLAVSGSEREAATSALTGGGCLLLPNAWLAVRARRPAVAGSELASGLGMLLAMVGKLVLTVALLALAMAWLDPLMPLAFFGGFIVAVAAHHGALLFEDAPDKA